MMHNHTDEQLLKLVIHSRSGEALEEIYDRYAKLIFSFAIKAVKEEQAAREIVQMVFLRLWTTRKGYDPLKGAFVNWVITITRNITIDYLRKHRKQSDTARLEESQWGEALASSTDSTEDIVSRKWVGQQIQQAYVHLSPSQVQLVELMYWQGYSLSEIAARTNEPLGTVKSRLHQCLKLLRKHLTSLEGLR